MIGQRLVTIGYRPQRGALVDLGRRKPHSDMAIPQSADLGAVGAALDVNQRPERRRPGGQQGADGPGSPTRGVVHQQAIPGLGMGADDICHLAVIPALFRVRPPLCEEVVRKRCGGKEKHDPGDEPRLAGDGDDANRQDDGRGGGGEDQVARVVDRFDGRRVDEDDGGGHDDPGCADEHEPVGIATGSTSPARCAAMPAATMRPARMANGTL